VYQKASQPNLFPQRKIFSHYFEKLRFRTAKMREDGSLERGHLDRSFSKTMRCGQDARAPLVWLCVFYTKVIFK
jgi:hypothetical protein